MDLMNVSGIEKVVEGLRDSFDASEAQWYAPEKVRAARRSYVQYYLGFKPDYRKQALFAASFGALNYGTHKEG
jgi:hypothetical protein